MLVRRIVMLALLAGLSACARAPLPALPPVVQAPQILDPDAACLQDLATLGVDFKAVDSFGDPAQGCGIANAVKVSAAGVMWNRPGVLTCAMARNLARYQTEVVQPLAQSRFGQPVKRIHHAGTYDCRVRRNNSTKVAASLGGSRGGRLSEHSKGQAIDLTAFELADGTMVSVKNDWRGPAAKAGFLHEVARASCNNFN
ncbi:MAG: extensin family protein, partial [Magnetospirillum sp.]|nr:extensin family protein [Magnetospirillum sp.]